MVHKSAYLVIDKAISENRYGEFLLYGLSTLVVLTGIFTIIYGALNGEALIALSGAIASSVVFPAFYLARDMRRQNIAIRLLEVLLKSGKTPEEAAGAMKIISQAFEEVFIKAEKKKS